MESSLFRFLNVRLFRRSQIATIAEHERLVDDVVELFRMPIEQELCTPEVAAAPAPDAPLIAEAPVAPRRIAV
jgi:hypothetical protein